MEGDRIRVNAQLIDAIKGYHMWSESYDRQLDDIFALQDDVMKNILFELRVKLVEGEQLRYWFKDREYNFKRWNTVQLMGYHYLKGTPEGFEMAKQIAHELIEKWPAFTVGYVWVSFLELVDILSGRSKSSLKGWQYTLYASYNRKWTFLLSQDLRAMFSFYFYL